MKYALFICIAIIVILLIKLISMKNSLRILGREFAMHSDMDSNTLIGIPSRDRDIRHLADGINKSLAKIRDKYQKYAKGDMEMRMSITNISHDLRTPLTAICGYLELLKNVEKSPELEEYLSIIENRALYMKDLTNELFEYSVLVADSANKVLELENVFVNQVLEDTLMEYYGALCEKNITPNVDITDKEIYRNLNKAGLERVFGNLISNALKYSIGDLKITLDESGAITFANKAPKLSSLDVERLFDRFYTVETSSVSTGLGLSIAKNLVKQMNGEIVASYEDGSLIIKLSF